MDSQKTLTAMLRYVRGKMAISEIQAGCSDGTGENNNNFVDIPVRISDARLFNPRPRLEISGFELLVHPSIFLPKTNDPELVSQYNIELEALLLSATNAKTVKILEHTWRSSKVDPKNPGKKRAPVFVVHNDYTPKSAFETVRSHLSDSCTDFQLISRKHFLLITIWRSVSGTINNFPLAVCDRRSITSGDLLPVTRHRKSFSHALQLAKYNESHEWFYYPQMQENEALLFVCFDSTNGPISRPTLHSALRDNTRLLESHIRISVESRCALFFD